MSAEVDTTTQTEKPSKKDWEIKQVVEENVKGHVKWYDITKNYGFISRNDGGGDVFVHRSVISQYTRRFPSLGTGEEVQFTVVETGQGIEAYSVTGPEGKPVKGQVIRYPRRNGGKMRGNNHYDDNVSTEHQLGVENGGAGQQPGPNAKGTQRRGFNRFAREGKENQQHSSSDVGVAGDGNDAAEGDSPNQSDQRQRRPRRRPPAYRNRNMQSGNGPASDSTANAAHHQSDGGDEHPPRARRRPRRRRPANGQAAKETAENGHEVQPGESSEQANGLQKGPSHSQRRNNSKGKSSTTDVVDSTGTDNQAVEKIVVATEQCKLSDPNCSAMPTSDPASK